MAHLLRQPILSLGADVLARPPRRIAVNTPASSSLRAPAASVGLDCLVTLPTTYPGLAPGLCRMAWESYE